MFGELGVVNSQRPYAYSAIHQPKKKSFAPLDNHALSQKDVHIHRRELAVGSGRGSMFVDHQRYNVQRLCNILPSSLMMEMFMHYQSIHEDKL